MAKGGKPHGEVKLKPAFRVMTHEFREALKYCEKADSKKEHETCKKLLKWAENPEKYRKPRT